MLDKDSIVEAGLDPQVVAVHKQRVGEVLGAKGSYIVKILDTCRLDNGGVLAADWAASAASAASELSGFVGFVPAAGASSRYVAALEPLEDKLKRGDKEGVKDALESMKEEGADLWALPQSLKALLVDPSKALELSEKSMLLLASSIRLPKALMPCSREGVTFLEMKQKEHACFSHLEGEVYVVPFGCKDMVAKKAPKALILEQGKELSTLRFYENGAAVKEPGGGLSVVPAGHGTLTRLFPACQKVFSSSHSLFIRNIDNVMGTSKEVVAAAEVFMANHQYLLSGVKKIRAGLNGGPMDVAVSCCEELFELCKVALPLDSREFIKGRQEKWRPFYRVLCGLFQMSKDLVLGLCEGEEDDRERLKRLFARPVNSLGQVPNNGLDVGGTPAFVELGGVRQKLCVEVPHVSKGDFEKYMKDPKKATHFNPVFVAAEMAGAQEAYPLDVPLWLLAKKQFRGESVYYYETVLYELLGNNSLANAVFVEVPRAVFNPHKSLKDAKIKSLKEWS